MDVSYREVCGPLLLASFTWPDAGRVFLFCSGGQHSSRLVEEPQGVYLLTSSWMMGCFLFLATVNDATVNICGQIFQGMVGVKMRYF